MSRQPGSRPVSTGLRRSSQSGRRSEADQGGTDKQARGEYGNAAGNGDRLAMRFGARPDDLPAPSGRPAPRANGLRIRLMAKGSRKQQDQGGHEWLHRRGKMSVRSRCRILVFLFRTRRSIQIGAFGPESFIHPPLQSSPDLPVKGSRNGGFRGKIFRVSRALEIRFRRFFRTWRTRPGKNACGAAPGTT